MAIKQAQYNLTVKDGIDTYHFQTDDEMVKIVDDNNNIVGTFKEFAMEGKLANSGSYKDLKVNGIYKIRGLSGLPAGYDVVKTSILSVKSIGSIGTPDFTFYELISQSGEIYHNTVMGNSETGWTSGGTALKNSIKLMGNQIGDISKLTTNSKVSLVNAVNELKSLSDSNKSELASLGSNQEILKTHNHDERYVIKNGDSMIGDLLFDNGKSMQGKKFNGTRTNLIGMTASDDIEIGQSGTKININASEITFNKNKLWHQNNDGIGSGLDADLLGGTNHSNYARLDKGQVDFAGAVTAFRSMNAAGGFGFGTDSSKITTSFNPFGNGGIRVYNNGNNYHSFYGSGELVSEAYHEISSANRETGIKFKLNGNDGGIGFFRNNSSKHLGMWDWNRKKGVLTVSHSDGVVNFQEPVSVQGRKLFLQSGTPTGTIPAGSIWIS